MSICADAPSLILDSSELMTAPSASASSCRNFWSSSARFVTRRSSFSFHAQFWGQDSRECSRRMQCGSQWHPFVLRVELSCSSLLLVSRVFGQKQFCEADGVLEQGIRTASRLRPPRTRSSDKSTMMQRYCYPLAALPRLGPGVGDGAAARSSRSFGLSD